jgi:hypothetical protein
MYCLVRVMEEAWIPRAERVRAMAVMVAMKRRSWRVRGMRGG